MSGMYYRVSIVNGKLQVRHCSEHLMYALSSELGPCISIGL